MTNPMTSTHTLSRRIVAALDPDGTKWPRYHRNDAVDGSLVQCTNVPDLAAPENLHLLLDIADVLIAESDGSWGLFRYAKKTGHEYLHVSNVCAHPGRAHTRSLAVLAAVCAALGIDTTQEDEE